MNRPNIILITADQWRGDCLGAAGHPVIKTPNIDALAADAVLFRSHFSATAPCSPARASLYTGLYQMNHRVVQNGAPLLARLDNLAKAARRAGYLPTLFGYTDTSQDPRCLHPNDPDLTTYEKVLPGMHVGQMLPEDDKPWITWLKRRGHRIENADQVHVPDMEGNERVSMKAPFYRADETQTAFLLEKFDDWLDEREGAESPFFAHLSFLRPHPPFVVPEPFNEMYDPGGGPPYARLASSEAEGQSHPLIALIQSAQKMSSFLPYGADGEAGPTDLARDLSGHDIARIRALYYGMISEVDEEIGRLIANLKQRGLWETTLFIFTSDHAEMMGDHWMLGKGGFHQGSYHIPLIIRAPGGGRGKTVDAFTSSADIFPTLLDVLDKEATNSLDGASLMEHVQGKPVSGWRDAAFYEFDFRAMRASNPDLRARNRQQDCRLAVLRDEAFQYVHCPGMPTVLFDLEKDPDCLVNVADEDDYLAIRLAYAERMLDLRARHLDETLARYVVGNDGAALIE
ncbi:Arylsulfatase A [Cohaesibacter sp. ES.047]|uniref:sulfatase-like hydrolase/transferase n=1 Tax=Cohaesibacter sp. ES.047 TaxID=1798205 RepID=UPI000BBF8B88|nr:sulfatase-like hydrolase/transferase [Cohaesibacter sp. ES.047]SNY92642.1 Arylsulfatase A [Cohaesibacter sp. ES.047]